MIYNQDCNEAQEKLNHLFEAIKGEVPDFLFDVPNPEYSEYSPPWVSSKLSIIETLPIYIEALKRGFVMTHPHDYVVCLQLLKSEALAANRL